MKCPQILQYAVRHPGRWYRSGLNSHCAGSLCGPQDAIAARAAASSASTTEGSITTGAGVRQIACSLASTSGGVVVMVVIVAPAFFCTRPRFPSGNTKADALLVPSGNVYLRVNSKTSKRCTRLLTRG